MSIAKHQTAALFGRDIRKTFRRETGEVVHALDGVSLEAAHGTLTALVGPDGAGKTTLIRLAAGLMSADGGELKILGVDVSADPQQVQDRIGYMPQPGSLHQLRRPDRKCCLSAVRLAISDHGFVNCHRAQVLPSQPAK